MHQELRNSHQDKESFPSRVGDSRRVTSVKPHPQSPREFGGIIPEKETKARKGKHKQAAPGPHGRAEPEREPGVLPSEPSAVWPFVLKLRFSRIRSY